VLDSYLDYIQEGYIISDKTVSVNLDEFENGTKNKLLIVGVLGSGKTSLAEYIAKKYNVPLISDASDIIIKSLKDSKRNIIEGSQIARLYKDNPSYRKFILNEPMIIIGMSAIRAGLRADKRDGTTITGAKNWKDIHHFVRVNIKKTQGYLNFLREDVMKIPSAKIKEYKIPKFKTVRY